MQSSAEQLGSAMVGVKRTDSIDLAELVERYHPLLTRVCYVITDDGELAADAVQNTWAIAVRKAHQIRSAEAAKSWLIAVATNEARAVLRSQHRTGRIRNALEAQQRSTTSVETSPGLGLIADLPPSDRQLLALVYVAGLSSAEVGAVLGLTAEGVRSRKFRLIKRLRAEMKP